MSFVERTPMSDRTVVSIDALGVRMRLAGDHRISPAAVASIRAAWRDCLGVDDDHDAGKAIRVPDDVSQAPARALSDLSTQVTLAALDALRGTRLLLHAAGVAAPDGRVLAMVGPSGRGKTTASRHAATKYGYVSDESVAVDSVLTVWPYRKPLSVIVEGEQFKQQIAPSDLGLLPLPPAPLQLVGITLLERDPDTDAPGIFSVDLIDAICEMTPQISYLPELPSPLQYVAGIIDRIGGVTRLIYRDATELPAVVADMFAAAPPAAQRWSSAPEASTSGAWRCAPVEDAILVEGRACILREGVVTALDHRGCLVWTMCRRGANAREITDAAVAAFGEPADGDAAALIAQTIDELVGHGLLERA